METKARRVSRAPAPVGAPAEPVGPIKVNSPSNAPATASTDAPQPAGAASTPQAPNDSLRPAESLASFESLASLSQGGPIARVTDSAWPGDLAGIGRDALAAFTQSQEALAKGLEALGAEMAGLAFSGIDTVTRAASGMIGVKTFSDAIDVNAGLACSSLDRWVGGSARMSELAVKLAAEISRPILTQLGKGWVNTARHGSGN